MPTNKEYWNQRFTILQESQLSKGEAYVRDVEDQFTKAQASVQRKIEMWYGRFAANNQIDLAEAKKLLSGRDLKEFKWTVEDYIKFGEKNAVDPLWMRELENASARVHVSRLEALKLQMQQEAEVLFGNHLDGTDHLMRRIFDDGYYHTAYEIQKGFNVGWDLQGYDSKRLEQVISKPWTADGRTFSDRIWTTKRELINDVHTGLTQSLIRGDHPRDLIERIGKKFNTKKSNAGRLIMTESAFFASAAQQTAFNDLDVERFEVVATLDSHTSEICQDLDGHVEDMKNFEVGVTSPPFHVWCRSTTVPYFDDNFGERAARGADGETYYVPSNMKYHDWKKTVVDGGSDYLKKLDPKYLEKFIAVVGRVPTIDEIHFTEKDLDHYLIFGEFPKEKIKHDFGRMSNDQLAEYARKNLKTQIGDLAGVSGEYAQETIRILSEFEDRMGGSIDGLKVKFGGTSAGEYASYDPTTKTLKLKKTGTLEAFQNSQLKENERALKKFGNVQHIETDFGGTLWHELGHVIDHDTGYQLSKFIEIDKDLFKEAIKISNYAGNTGGGLTGNKASEAFAEQFSAWMNKSGNEGLVNSQVSDLIERYFHNKRFDIFEEYVDESKLVKVLTLEDKIQAVKAKIAASGGSVTEDHLHEAGKAVREELMDRRKDLQAELDRLSDELAEFDKLHDLDAMKKQSSKYRGARRGLYSLEEVGVGSREELDDLIRELDKKMDQVNSDREVIMSKIRPVRSAHSKNWKENAQELKDMISRIRPVGRGSNDLNDHLERSRSQMKAIVMDAYDYYPEEWVTKSVKRGTLTPKKVDRGFYSDFRSEIAISGYNEQSYIDTALHELGHRMERAVPEIRNAEKIFYDRRTAGESLQWLGGSYAKSEKSRFDKFLSTYMGKDYGGSAYELVSMGFQMSYMEPTILWTDEDMADWIYGILMLL